MRSGAKWTSLGVPLLALLTPALDAEASRNDARREFWEGVHEVERAKRDMRRDILRADSRRAFRQGVREIEREKREMRREIRREMRRDWRDW